MGSTLFIFVQTFSFKKTGSGALDLGNVFLRGTHSSQFSIFDDNASQQSMLPSNEVTVTFSPCMAKTISAELVIPSNDPVTLEMVAPLEGTSAFSSADIGPDGDVDGVDLAALVRAFGETSFESDLLEFSKEFGINYCFLKMRY